MTVTVAGDSGHRCCVRMTNSAIINFLWVWVCGFLFVCLLFLLLLLLLLLLLFIFFAAVVFVVFL